MKTHILMPRLWLKCATRGRNIINTIWWKTGYKLNKYRGLSQIKNYWIQFLFARFVDDFLLNL